MGRMYRVPLVATAKTAAGDILEYLAPSTCVICLHELVLGQHTDFGDAQAEILRISFHRVTGAPTSGSGGNTVTPAPLSPGDAAAGGTVESWNTTALTGGTSVDLGEVNMNVAVGMESVPIPEDRIYIAPSTRLMIKLAAAPADSITISGYATVEEIG